MLIDNIPQLACEFERESIEELVTPVQIELL